MRLKADDVVARELVGEITNSLYWFDKEVLGYDLVPHAHYDLCEFVDGRYTDTKDYVPGSNQGQLILMPRNSYKTSVVTIGHCLQQMSLNPNIRILLINEVLDTATGFLEEIKGHIETNEKFQAFNGFLQGGDIWTKDKITISTRTVRKKEPTLTCAGIGTVKVGNHYDLIILDDLHSHKNVTSTTMIKQVIDTYKLAWSLLDPHGKMVVIGCLVAGSKVSMADGTTKSIEKVKVGEKVISHDSIETVEAMIPQGKAIVYELKTQHHTIQATGNHPFLTKDGFKKLEDLSIGEKIFSQGYKEGGSRKYSKEQMWILGFMFGDGWIIKCPHKGKENWVRRAVCFSAGVDEKLNKKAFDILAASGSSKGYLTKGGYYRFDSRPICEYLESLGFKGKAKTKRIPEYVYGLSDGLRESFIDGFLEADGWYTKKGQRATELCNKKFIEDLKHLCEITGYRVSNIFERTRISQPPNSPKPVLSKTAHISIGKIKKKDKFKIETVRSIKEIGEKEVYDLTVSNTHNFIANGLVVHNTRWSFFDLYHHITETERHRFDVFKRSAHNPDGSLFFPEVLSERWLADQRKSQSSYIYSCQYENDPVDDENAAFRKEWLAYWHKDSAGQFRPVEKETEYKEGYAPVFYRAEQMYWYMSIDPAIADKTGSDETAMVVTAIDPDDRVFIIYADSFKVSPTGIINKTFDLLDRYPHIRSVGIETTIFQRSIRFAMYKAFKDAQRPMLIEELPTPWTTSKEQRILGLVPRFEFREIFLGKNMHKLEDQLIRFPVGKHDDVLDALAHQQLMWKKPPKDMKRSAPEGSWNYYHNKLKELRASSGEEHWGNMRAKEYKNGTYYA